MFRIVPRPKTLHKRSNQLLSHVESYSTLLPSRLNRYLFTSLSLYITSTLLYQVKSNLSLTTRFCRKSLAPKQLGLDPDNNLYSDCVELQGNLLVLHIVTVKDVRNFGLSSK